MSKRSSNNSSRRKFIRNTSLAAAGLLIVPPNVLGSDFGVASGAALAANNPTQLENAKAGTTAWQLTNPAMNREVEGYASLTSVNRGGQINFFVSVALAQQVNLQFYRMGWYGGNGGRLLMTTSIAGINQPTPAADANGLIECSWASQFTLTVPNNTTDPTDWASGIYLIKLTAQTSGYQSYIIFIVRDDTRISDFLYQASFSTYQAYNNWPFARSCGQFCPGSRSLYPHNSDAKGPAYKVSFNRPFAVGLAPKSELGVGAGEFLNNVQPGQGSHEGAGWEYNMVRWLEMKGYDVTYATSVDTHEKADLFLSGTTKRHKGFLSVGHDEYWSWEMRTRVEQARDNGVSLGFFSSNVCYWQVRFESSLKNGQANRTMVSYKNDALSKDPYYLDADTSNNRLVTTWWRESPVNRPEAAMVGVMFWGNSYLADMLITKPEHWVYSGTNLALNEKLSGLIGYECDSVVASSPTNIEVVAHSPVVDTRYADTTIYTVPSGAVVFAAASNQFSWGLDDYYASSPFVLRPSRLNFKFQQMISNLLARFVGDIFPVARSGGPYSGAVGSAVSFNGNSSSDADGTIVSYLWTFGDGATGTGATTSHAYASDGTYSVNLVVIDDKGAAHSSSTTATIGTGIAAPTHQAYIATTTTGTQNFGGELGMEFKVNNAAGVTIDQLGAFDHQGNGIAGTQSGGIRVAIFNKTTKTIVPGLDAIIIGTADSYTGNHRMKNLTPVTLMPGDYVVVAKGYNASELNGNSGGGTPFPVGDLGGGAISYASTCWYGSEAPGFSYPNNADGGPGNRYLAGTFRYSFTATQSSVNAPSGLNAANAKGNSPQVKLGWVDNSNNEELFRIERSLAPSSGFTEIGQVTANISTYSDKNIQNLTTYYYRVRGSNGNTFSTYSNTVSIITKA